MKIAAVLLAAGLSTRFGVDKIAIPLGGTPIGEHAARTLSELRVAERLVVARGRAPGWPGFTVIVNDNPAAGMSHSIRLGVQAARARRADAVLIALADMPLVSSAHLRRLIASARGADALVASTDGVRPMPPCLFGAAWFDALETLAGDQGARELLAQAELVVAPAGELIDVDDPATLDRLRRGA